MKIVIDDGGRAAAGYKGDAGDCVTRAIAIATGLPYATVYAQLFAAARSDRMAVATGKTSPRNGVRTKTRWFKDYMASLGWTWTPTMGIGTGCKVHLREDELPMGRVIASVSKHMVAVIDGVLHDTYDSTRGGTRCVYGYWTRQVLL